jgi:hypothetical protein
VKIFRKLRSSYGEKYLIKKSRNLIRNKHAHNFQTAKTVGILFDAGIPDSLRRVREFGKFLSEQKILCSYQAYVNSEEISSELLFHDQINIFCNKDLDLFFRPKNPDALAFMSTKFDMLIDLTIISNFPTKYILNLSPSVFKVGKYNEESIDLDLMIDIHSKPDLGYLIEQIKYYVSILNNPNATINN